MPGRFLHGQQLPRHICEPGRGQLCCSWHIGRRQLWYGDWCQLWDEWWQLWWGDWHDVRRQLHGSCSWYSCRWLRSHPRHDFWRQLQRWHAGWRTFVRQPGRTVFTVLSFEIQLQISRFAKAPSFVLTAASLGNSFTTAPAPSYGTTTYGGYYGSGGSSYSAGAKRVRAMGGWSLVKECQRLRSTSCLGEEPSVVTSSVLNCEAKTVFSAVKKHTKSLSPFPTGQVSDLRRMRTFILGLCLLRRGEPGPCLFLQTQLLTH